MAAEIPTFTPAQLADGTVVTEAFYTLASNGIPNMAGVAGYTENLAHPLVPVDRSVFLYDVIEQFDGRRVHIMSLKAREPLQAYVFEDPMVSEDQPEITPALSYLSGLIIPRFQYANRLKLVVQPDDSEPITVLMAQRQPPLRLARLAII